MPIVRKTNIKCSNSKCKAKICREWCLGIMMKGLVYASLIFKCNKCQEMGQVTMPVYIINKVKLQMPSDPSLVYIEGEYIPRQTIDAISDEEEQIFVKMMQENPLEFMGTLKSMTTIDMDNFEKE